MMVKLKIGITGFKGVFASNFINLYKNQYTINKFKGDITSKNQIKRWLKSKDFDFLIHAAAKVPIKYVSKNYNYSYKVNVIGTKNIVDNLLVLKKNCFLVFLSTAQVYNFSKKPISENSNIKPISKYGKTKYLAEKYIIKKLHKKDKYSILRIFSYTDKKQSTEFFIPSIVKKIKKEKILFKTNKLLQKRDFIHIKDLCRVVSHVIEFKLNGILNVGSGKSYQLNYIVSYLCKRLKKKLVFNDKILRKRFKNEDLFPNIKKLKKSGFKFNYNIKNILEEFI